MGSCERGRVSGRLEQDLYCMTDSSDSSWVQGFQKVNLDLQSLARFFHNGLKASELTYSRRVRMCARRLKGSCLLEGVVPAE